MKSIFLFFLLVLSFDLSAQQQAGDSFFIACNPPFSARQIVSSDTSMASHSNVIVILNYDRNKMIVSGESITDTKNTYFFDFKNIAKARYSLTYYDTAGHVICESITENGIRFHCYSYKYNDRGQLVYKEGYSSGEMGVKISYKYSAFGRLVKETIERSGGTITRNY